MLIGTATSKKGVAIRLTDERWLHILYSHTEINPSEFPVILDIIENPDAVLEGDTDELLAVRKAGKRGWLVVAYKEVSKKDGFVLTTYVTTDARWLFKKKVLWSKESQK